MLRIACGERIAILTLAATAWVQTTTGTSTTSGAVSDSWNCSCSEAAIRTCVCLFATLNAQPAEPVATRAVTRFVARGPRLRQRIRLWLLSQREWPVAWVPISHCMLLPAPGCTPGVL
jgi:hypothetical protein